MGMLSRRRRQRPPQVYQSEVEYEVPMQAPPPYYPPPQYYQPYYPPPMVYQMPYEERRERRERRARGRGWIAAFAAAWFMGTLWLTEIHPGLTLICWFGGIGYLAYKAVKGA